MSKAASTATASALPGHVYVVDDDPDFRMAVVDLLESENIACSAYASTEALLDRELEAEPACLVLDVQFPGGSGLDLQQQLQELDRKIPIIFMTGHGDVEMCAKAMKRGAAEFLTKPLSADRLMSAVQEALTEDQRRSGQRLAMRTATAAMQSLTPREHEVLILVADGLLNKQIADRMAISEVTVKLHRGNVMRKFGVRSLARLMAILAHLPPAALTTT